MSDPVFLSIVQQTRLIDAGTLDPVALTRRYLDRAETVGKPLNSVVTLCRETALAAAEASAARAQARRRLGPLDGIAIALKDNIDLAGVPTSNGFGGAPWRVPTEDAAVVHRLRAAGAVILGKLNMHEGALGATNDNPHLGRATNPHRAGFTPGGSSGGSGIAVAAGLCAAALGTDTGGSVRLPAAYCGVVGLKPSFGLVSTRGVVPLSYTLDHVGPLTRSVADAALMLHAMAGFDPDSPESRRLPTPSTVAPASGRLTGLRFGVIRNFDDEAPEPPVVASFGAARRQIEQLGATIETLTLPSYDMARGRRAGFVRVEVEAAFVHGALYQREPDRFSPTMCGYLEFGARATAQQVLLADRRIALGAYELAGCFDRVDAILSPTAPQAAFAFDQKPPDNQSGFTILANFAGCPAISVPMGKTADGLPLGLQVMAPVGHEDRVLQIAASYEAAAGWQLPPPPPYGPA